MQASNAKWFKPTNLSSGRLRQDGCHNFNTSLDYVVFPSTLETSTQLDPLSPEHLSNIGAVHLGLVGHQIPWNWRYRRLWK